MAVETAENMAALNVDYIAWIITVLGTINSNHTIIFDLNYLLWKFKTSKRQVVRVLLETKHKVFRFKTKPIPQYQSKTLKVASKFLSPMLNFHSHLRPAGWNILEPPKIWGSLCFQVLGHSLCQTSLQNFRSIPLKPEAIVVLIVSFYIWCQLKFISFI